MGCGRVAVRYWFSLKEVKTECTSGCWSWRMPSNKAYCLKQGVRHVSSFSLFLNILLLRLFPGVSTCFDKRWVNKPVFLERPVLAPVCSMDIFHVDASSFGYRHCKSLTAADSPLVSRRLRLLPSCRRNDAESELKRLLTREIHWQHGTWL